jgi:hypothetical protein
MPLMAGVQGELRMRFKRGIQDGGVKALTRDLYARSWAVGDGRMQQEMMAARPTRAAWKEEETTDMWAPHVGDREERS